MRIPSPSDNEITKYKRSDGSLSQGGVPNPPGPVGMNQCNIPTSILQQVVNLGEPTEEEYDIVLPISGSGYAMKIEARRRTNVSSPDGGGEKYVSFNGYRRIQSEAGYAEKFSVIHNDGDEILAVDGEVLHDLSIEDAIPYFKRSMCYTLDKKNVTFFRLRKVQFVNAARTTPVSRPRNAIESEPEPREQHVTHVVEGHFASAIQDQHDIHEMSPRPGLMSHHDDAPSTLNASVLSSNQDQHIPAPDPVHSAPVEDEITDAEAPHNLNRNSLRPPINNNESGFAHEADNTAEMSPVEPSNFDLNTDDEEGTREEKKDSFTCRDGIEHTSQLTVVPIMDKKPAPEETTLPGPEAEESSESRSLDDILFLRCRNQYSWSEDFAKRAIHAYRQFLGVVESLEDFNLENVTPNMIVNQVWLQHVADPKGYESDCFRIMGRTLYRNPDIVPLEGKENNQTHMMLFSKYGKANVDHEIWTILGKKKTLAACGKVSSGAAHKPQASLSTTRHQKRDLPGSSVSFHSKRSKQDLPNALTRSQNTFHERNRNVVNREVDLDAMEVDQSNVATPIGQHPTNGDEKGKGTEPVARLYVQGAMQQPSSAASSVPVSQNERSALVNQAPYPKKTDTLAAKATTIQETKQNCNVVENSHGNVCVGETVAKASDSEERVKEGASAAASAEHDDKPQAGREAGDGGGMDRRGSTGSLPTNADNNDQEKGNIQVKFGTKEQSFTMRVYPKNKLKKAFKKYAEHIGRNDYNELIFILERTGETLKPKKTFCDVNIVNDDFILCKNA